jgi:hypothetical protein
MGCQVHNMPPQNDTTAPVQGGGAAAGDCVGAVGGGAVELPLPEDSQAGLLARRGSTRAAEPFCTFPCYQRHEALPTCRSLLVGNPMME